MDEPFTGFIRNRHYFEIGTYWLLDYLKLELAYPTSVVTNFILQGMLRDHTLYKLQGNFERLPLEHVVYYCEYPAIMPNEQREKQQFIYEPGEHQECGAAYSYVADNDSLLECRELVESVAEQHGYLGEGVLSQMSPEVRRKVEKAMPKKDEMIGSSVITSARFVFELFQNADDNSYSKAKSLSSVPFVSFQVYPQRVVMERNEDGFTRENLIAICNIRKSSKSGAQGYIG
ncbi:hypothetical protein EMCG_09532 [[Emmonsia] crescens]|uniref:Uncharacterized protein n=1 Tax=[Emmonsia] crescens TaxID=73230 RepID=A0A0G2I2T7_9EURO|nr:hypothetical protein EMCG_09532 [Emmonsia crescens UAMH 3008]